MNLEELQEKLLQTEEQFKTLQEDYNQTKQLLEEKQIRVRELEEYNQKLFLRATATQKHEDKKEEYTSKLLGDYANLLNDDELELLKEIEEEL